jgi:2'-5' RNA ligase
MAGTQRLFIAVACPVDDDVYQGLRRLLPPSVGARWAPAADLHVTLKFLGNVEAARVPALMESIKKSVAGQACFHVELGGFGFFPVEKSPRVLWAGVREGAEPLKELSRILETTLTAAGFPKADHPFQPHVTLARLDGKTPAPQAALQEISKKAFGTFTVSNVHLMSSQLTPRGAVYREEASFALQENRPAP